MFEEVSDQYYLRALDPKDLDSIYNFMNLVPANTNGFQNPDAGKSLADWESEVLPRLLKEAAGIDLKPNRVPQTYYFLWEAKPEGEDQILALFKLRHHLTPELKQGGGHVGYFVHPDFRSQGLGTRGLELLLPVAAHLVPEDHLYAAMEVDNRASQALFAHFGAEIWQQTEQDVFMRIDLSPFRE
ncbi:hypothetical protein BSR28_03880 [Boudabousia liubingyangii]|uniref:GNAT family N-acetyltransferase n=1 Tax=Boudabousia liubingyangii TaxID=1921764 RepID=UPI00093F44F0|nr:GNAT family N-acetyltransferase [Boudabousia liubingyangii]OKL47636.1 hypothetical protein BSR28_03880 [Boudabousia liubingyangii]